MVDTTVRVDSCAEAEMAKLLENTFRHVNIALVNELAVFAHGLGVDIWRVIDAASTKPFGFMRFTPGPGVGGHCLPVDPSYLAWRIEEQLGSPFKFVSLANEVNQSMPEYVVGRARTLLALADKELRGSRVLLLGLSFKKGTSDCRESPSMKIAALLMGEGAHVSAADPYVSAVNLGAVDFDLVQFNSISLTNTDLVLLLVDHPEFVPSLIAMHAPLVLDTKGCLRGARACAARRSAARCCERRRGGAHLVRPRRVGRPGDARPRRHRARALHGAPLRPAAAPERGRGRRRGRGPR
jgi:nucleotide sugar dehydrogenase